MKFEKTIDNIRIVENFVDSNDLQDVDSFLQTWIPTDKDFFVVPIVNNKTKNFCLKYPKIAHILAEDYYRVEIEREYLNNPSPVIWRTGAFMEEHVDLMGLMNEKDYDISEHPDVELNDYTLAAIIYINDAYEGGELCFPDFDLQIKPKAGTLILFPSNSDFKHSVNEVKSGNRFTVATWYKVKEKNV